MVIVAHSYGGEIATAFIAENPGRVLRGVLVDANIPAFFTDEETAKMTAGFPTKVDTSDKQGRAMAALFKVYPSMQHDFHDMVWPASVIVSEHPPLTTPSENAKWTEDHKEFAAQAPNRTFEIARGSGHLVMTDRPDVVTEAGVSALNQAR